MRYFTISHAGNMREMSWEERRDIVKKKGPKTCLDLAQRGCAIYRAHIEGNIWKYQPVSVSFETMRKIMELAA